MPLARQALKPGAYVHDKAANRLFEVRYVDEDAGHVNLEDARSPVDGPQRTTHSIDWAEAAFELIRPGRELGELLDPQDIASEDEWGTAG